VSFILFLAANAGDLQVLTMFYPAVARWRRLMVVESRSSGEQIQDEIRHALSKLEKEDELRPS